MNSKLLRSIMLMHGDTNKTLSEYLGISETSLSNRINSRGTDFRQGEIVAIKNRYNLTADQVEEIFFATECLN